MYLCLKTIYYVQDPALLFVWFSVNNRSSHVGLVHPSTNIPCLDNCNIPLTDFPAPTLTPTVYSKGILLKGKQIMSLFAQN